ncbi:MAG: ABC transporter permease [Rhodospirillales bacterium]|nr:ABC transporter permease [Rhodospirillales bacterium]
MATALLRRLGQLLLVLVGVSLLAFLMVHLVPGDAAQIQLGASDASPQKLAILRHEMGLDRPLAVQYALWLGRVLRGDFGVSLDTGRPVLTEIADRAPVTAELTVAGLVLAVTLAIPAGCLMAALRGRTADVVVRLISVLGLTMPSFWLGTMLLYGASVSAPSLAVVGWVPFRQNPLANLERLVLPTIALALPVLASLARILRSAMIEALEQDYIRTARAKGLPAWLVLARHALANALIPFMTAAGILAGYLFGGSVVVEQVFALPGLGRLMVGAIEARDYPLVQAAILLATAIFVVVNFVVDMLVMAADPRARGA